MIKQFAEYKTQVCLVIKQFAWVKNHMCF